MRNADIALLVALFRGVLGLVMCRIALHFFLVSPFPFAACDGEIVDKLCILFFLFVLALNFAVSVFLKSRSKQLVVSSCFI